MKRLLVTLILLFPVYAAGQDTNVRIANGRDTTQGSTTDSAVTGDNSGTISAKIRGLNKVWFSVWDSVNNRLNVNITNATLAATQSGTWNINNISGTVSLPTGASTEATLALIKAKTDNLDVLLSTRTKPADTQTVSVSNTPTVALSQTTTANDVDANITNSSLAVTGPLTDTQLRASAVPISASSLPLPTGASTGAKQDTGNTSLSSIDTKTPALGQALAASSTPVVLTAIQQAALTPPAAITGFNLETTQALIKAKTDNLDVALSTRLKPADTLAAVTSITNTVTTKADTIANQANPMVVTLGNTVGKTNVLKTGTLASSATTADQVVLTYTVTAGKTFFLQTWDVSMGLTTPGTTAIGGSCSLESPSGTKLDTNVFRSVGHQAYISQTYAEPVGIAAGTVIRFVCTPAVVTATTWAASFAGYER